MGDASDEARRLCNDFFGPMKRRDIAFDFAPTIADALVDAHAAGRAERDAEFRAMVEFAIDVADSDASTGGFASSEDYAWGTQRKRCANELRILLAQLPKADSKPGDDPT